MLRWTLPLAVIVLGSCADPYVPPDPEPLVGEVIAEPWVIIDGFDDGLVGFESHIRNPNPYEVYFRDIEWELRVLDGVSITGGAVEPVAVPARASGTSEFEVPIDLEVIRGRNPPPEGGVPWVVQITGWTTIEGESLSALTEYEASGSLPLPHRPQLEVSAIEILHAEPGADQADVRLSLVGKHDNPGGAVFFSDVKWTLELDGKSVGAGAQAALVPVEFTPGEPGTDIDLYTTVDFSGLGGLDAIQHKQQVSVFFQLEAEVAHPYGSPGLLVLEHQLTMQLLCPEVCAN